MKFKLCALLSAVTFAVTACGGGGGDDNITVNQPTKPVENNEQPFEMKEQIIMWKGASKFAYSQSEMIINDSPTMLAGQDSNDKTALTKITVNGVDIPFNPVSSTINEFSYSANFDDSSVSGILYGAKSAYARFGSLHFINRENNLGDYVLFYQGNPTSLDDMKKLEKNADNVTYNGHALALEQGAFPYGLNSEILLPNNDVGIVGKAQFTVNFKDKTLKGDVNQWYDSENKVADIKPVNIDAKIRANTFAGTANKTGTVEGKFYGPNAANLAGSFNDKSQKLRGVFGAVKK